MTDFGVSFMLRVRNEEKTLRAAMTCLLENLTIPFEIVVVLHLCTDKSEDIVKELQEQYGSEKIKIHYYKYELSKCGYETLSTDASSMHSVVTYYNWCLKKLQYKWSFKWDGDFIASEPLLNFLNSESWMCLSNIRFEMRAENSTHRNREVYLSDCLTQYIKCIFWEVAIYQCGSQVIPLPDEVRIIHDSELSDVKPYWRRIPWYDQEDSEEAREVKSKYMRLVEDFGEEPVAMARASNPECDEIFINIKYRAKPDYVKFHE
jgi:glycosyltransferase involved in cell wall biosynthesis